MDALIKESLWHQFGAAIDALADAIHTCPEELWADKSKHLLFGFFVYHTLYWLDLNLDGQLKGFKPPAPFDTVERDPETRVPLRVFTKDELLPYLQHCRRKCRTTILNMSAERAAEVIDYGWLKQPFLELQLYTMRHVQEHASQLSLLIGQAGAAAPDWVIRAQAD